MTRPPHDAIKQEDQSRREEELASAWGCSWNDLGGAIHKKIWREGEKRTREREKYVAQKAEKFPPPSIIVTMTT